MPPRPPWDSSSSSASDAASHQANGLSLSVSDPWWGKPGWRDDWGGGDPPPCYGPRCGGGPRRGSRPPSPTTSKGVYINATENPWKEAAWKEKEWKETELKQDSAESSNATGMLMHALGLGPSTTPPFVNPEPLKPPPPNNYPPRYSGGNYGGELREGPTQRSIIQIQPKTPMPVIYPDGYLPQKTKKDSDEAYIDKLWNEHKSDDKPTGVNIGLVVGIPVAVICLLVLCIVAFCCWRRRARGAKGGVLGVVNRLRKPTSNAYDKYDQNNVLPSAPDPWELERSRLVVNYDKKLGSGAFCNVFKGKIIGEAPVCKIGVRSMRVPSLTDAEVAVKTLPAFADDIARSDLMQEINFMKSLAYHPHLVSMVGYVADRKSPLLLVEYCEKGDLLHLIREKKEEIISGYHNTAGLKLKDILSFSWQISNGLEYLNNVGCIHRDIAARNVLVDRDNVCKIGDFGLCRLTDSLLYQARGGRLPLKWMAPEALANLEYSFKSDVWSYGVLLWELFSFGDVPFASIQTTELLAHLQRGGRLEKPQWCTDQVYDVMLKCWAESSAMRPSFTQIGAMFTAMLEHATEAYGYLVAVPPATAYENVESPPMEVDNV